MENQKITKDGTKISFRIDEYTAEQLKKIASKHYMSMSAFIRKSIDESIR